MKCLSQMYLRLLASFYVSEFKFLSSHLTILLDDILLFLIMAPYCATQLQDVVWSNNAAHWSPSPFLPSSCLPSPW